MYYGYVSSYDRHYNKLIDHFNTNPGSVSEMSSGNFFYSMSEILSQVTFENITSGRIIVVDNLDDKFIDMKSNSKSSGKSSGKGIFTRKIIVEQIYQISDIRLYRHLLEEAGEDIELIACLACCKNFVEVAKYLVDMGFNFDCYSSNKNAPFTGQKYIEISCIYNSHDVVEYLVDIGVPFDIKLIEKIMIMRTNKDQLVCNMIDILGDPNMFGPLLIKSMSFDNKIFKKLVEMGTDLSYRNYEVIESLVDNRDLELIKYAFQYINVNDFLQQQHVRPTIFKRACERGNLETMKFLVDIGIDINRSSRLILSSFQTNNCLEKCRYLIDSGYHKLDIIESLEVAARFNDNLDVIQYLFQFFDGTYEDLYSIFVEAIMSRCDKIVLWFINDQIINLNELDDNAIIQLILIGSQLIINTLIQNGIDIHLLDNRAIKKAVWSGNFATAKLLTEYDFIYEDDLKIQRDAVRKFKKYITNGCVEQILENPLEMINKWIENGKNFYW